MESPLSAPPPPYALPAQAAPVPPPHEPVPIAHWTHTAALLGILALTTLAGRARSLAPLERAEPHLTRYLSSILLEWLLAGSVLAGIYLRGPFLLRAFRSRARSTPAAFALGVPVYLTGLVTIAILGGALYFTPLRAHTNEAVVFAMLPHGPLEYLLWFGVSATAGITEELIFRGYLIQQFTAWTRNPWLAIVLGGLLFGSVHLYEGLGAIIPLAALGILFGVVVRLMRGDLRAVIVAHTLQDFVVPLLVLLRNYALAHTPKHL